MTPKEKAKELVDRMFGVQVDNQTFHMYNTLETAKYSALIAVDEILKDYSYMQNIRNANSNQIHSQRVYWQEVKQEIEAL